jgi:HSP20 family protein
MALMRWRPSYEFDPFRNLMRIQDEINRVFDLSMGRPFTETAEAEWAPAVDVYEDENNIYVKAELPGLTEKDVDVNIMDNNLVIKGQKKKEEEKKEKNFYRLERTYGEFYRSIPLPATVDAEKVKASFKQGVLEIEMPKKEEAKPKQIKVKAA